MRALIRGGGVRRGGVERANRLTVILLGLQRLSYLAPTLLALGAPGDRSPTLTIALVTVTVVWNVALFDQIRRHRWVPPWAPWVDVCWIVVVYVAATWNSAAEAGGGAPGWARRMGQAAAALAGAAIESVPLAVVAVLLLAVAYAVALAVSPAGLPAQFGELGGYVNGMVWFALIFGFLVRYLRRQGMQLDLATERRAAAEAQLAADQARLTHFRALHDTVLTTLVVIARGGLDHRIEQVRRRCARDAAFVRRLFEGNPTADRSSLDLRLTEVADAAQDLGLRVHYRNDPPPAEVEVPVEVTEAVGEAAREAVNNVCRHADVSACWLTLMWLDETLTVHVVDRGRGFDPDEQPAGFGLQWSVDARMRAVGGLARVHSAPGDGTTVELTWQP